MEAAFALASLVVVITIILAGVAATVDKIACVDAAREVARLTARGDEPAARSAFTALAPRGARLRIDITQDWVEVTVDVPVAGLLGMDVQARATSAREAVDR